ncbi:MAG: thioredoxin family protein [Armatimonadota bacterium]
MSSTWKVAIGALVVLAAVGIILSGGASEQQPVDTPTPPASAATETPHIEQEPSAPDKTEDTEAAPTSSEADAGETGMPRLVDLGAHTCIPCKMMEPVLEELKKDYGGRLDVEFIDISRDRQAAESYGVRVIPTQIFFDASGNEVARHEGYMNREDILKTFEQNGVEISPKDDAE